VVLLGGGTKKRQSRDIKAAQSHWAEYKSENGKVRTMALTRDFQETTKERAQSDPAFRIGLLTEAAECLLNNEVAVAKTLLRDYVNATIGFQELGSLTDKMPTSLMRMLSETGNPNLNNISKVLVSLRQHEGVQLHVSAG
jgi:DNA-binding phage protein